MFFTLQGPHHLVGAFFMPERNVMSQVEPENALTRPLSQEHAEELIAEQSAWEEEALREGK